MSRRPSLLSVAVVCIILSAGLSLAVECPFLYSELDGRCLLFRPNLALTWPNADTFCRSTNGSLAIVDDCTLLGQVARHIDNNADLTPDQGYWIGGTDEANEGNFTWVDGSEVPHHMPFWGSYYFQEEVYPEPNGGRNQNCLGLLSSDRYYFHDVECEREMAVLCEAPGNVTEATTNTVSTTTTSAVPATTNITVPATNDRTGPATHTTTIPDTSTTTAPCPPDYVLVGVACFKFFQESLLTWTVADHFCISNGGHLATLDDCDMLADVAEYINENGLRPDSLGYWIGATDVESEGLFRWTEDNSLVPLRMPFWGTGEGGPEPNGLEIENCVILDASDRYFFHDVMCSTERAVLCRAPGLMRLEKPRKNIC